MSAILVIRPRDKWEESIDLLSGSGYDVTCASVVRVEYLGPSELSPALQDLRSGKVGSLVFASVTAVRALSRSAPEAFASIPPTTEVVAIGPPTAKALEGMGVRGAVVPDEFTSQGLVELLQKGKGEVLMLRSDHGNAVLREGLEGRRGLRELIMYSLLEDRSGSLDQALNGLRAGRFDAVLHTSSLSAQLAVERSRQLFGDEWHMCWRTMNAAIGPPTRDTLLSLGIEVQIMPEKATFPHLVRAMHERLSARGSI